jgi:hypothetical protein
MRETDKIRKGTYLHPAQEEDEHPPQPELPPEPSDDLPMPKRERRFVVSLEPQDGQTTSGFEAKTSFSKQQLHLLH